MKLSYSVFSLLFFFLSSLYAKVEGPLDFTPPEGASVSFHGVEGLGCIRLIQPILDKP
ncbi:hypothetical protein N9A58_07800 [Opitutales bacterium]|nr:hypothetical protein [Opitutales bacterium]